MLDQRPCFLAASGCSIDQHQLSDPDQLTVVSSFGCESVFCVVGRIDGRRHQFYVLFVTAAAWSRLVTCLVSNTSFGVDAGRQCYLSAVYQQQPYSN